MEGVYWVHPLLKDSLAGVPRGPPCQHLQGMPASSSWPWSFWLAFFWCTLSANRPKICPKCHPHVWPFAWRYPLLQVGMFASFMHTICRHGWLILVTSYLFKHMLHVGLLMAPLFKSWLFRLAFPVKLKRYMFFNVLSRMVQHLGKAQKIKTFHVEFHSHSIHVWYISLPNVGKYAIHGWYGKGKRISWSIPAQDQSWAESPATLGCSLNLKRWVLGNQSIHETRATLGLNTKFNIADLTFLLVRSLFRGNVKPLGCICMFTLCIHVNLRFSSTLASLAQTVCIPNKNMYVSYREFWADRMNSYILWRKRVHLQFKKNAVCFFGGGAGWLSYA